MSETERTMQRWELDARENIRDVVNRYVCSVDRGRFDEVVSLFTSDAVFELRDDCYRGVDEIRTIFTAAATSLVSHQNSLPVVRHHLTSQQIDLHGRDRARSCSYFIAFVTSGVDHWGRYLDELVQVAGHWRISHRRDIIDGNVAGGWGDQT